jgi:hypothetical protein
LSIFDTFGPEEGSVTTPHFDVVFFCVSDDKSLLLLHYQGTSDGPATALGVSLMRVPGQQQLKGLRSVASPLTCQYLKAGTTAKAGRTV